MSYILEALRRADAERERGAVPHLHTQTMAAQADPDEAPRQRPWLWLTGGLALGLLAALAWALGPGRETAAPLALPVQTPAVEAAASVAPAAAVVVAPPANESVTDPSSEAPRGDVAAGPSAASSAVESIVPRSLPIAPSPMAKRPPTAANAEPAAAPRGEAARASNAASGAAPRVEAAVPALADLPAEVRSQLPTLTIGGSMYSQNAASRMLIVNGQVLREGDAVSATVTLEQIRLRSAVLRYKTWRYEIGF